MRIHSVNGQWLKYWLIIYFTTFHLSFLLQIVKKGGFIKNFEFEQYTVFSLFPVILEGIVEATGLTTQARTSYLPNEIRWGYRFEKVVRPFKDGSVRIDHDYFNKIYHVESTPRCSPKELYQRRTTDKMAENTAKGLPMVSLLPAPPPRPQYRRRSYTPQYVQTGPPISPGLQPDDVHITFDSVLTPTTSQQIMRRCSTPGPTALLAQPEGQGTITILPLPPPHNTNASNNQQYQDPLRCAASATGSSAMTLQPMELPRIRWILALFFALWSIKNGNEASNWRVQKRYFDYDEVNDKPVLRPFNVYVCLQGKLFIAFVFRAFWYGRCVDN